MTIKKSEHLRKAEKLCTQIAAMIPTNPVEVETKRLLLRLARAHRAQLRRELATSRIKNVPRRAA